MIDNTYCYLIGAMDRVPDRGKSWREKVKHDLPYKIKWLDPCDKPCLKGKEMDMSERDDLRKQGKYDEISHIMKEIRQIDLRMVDKADWCFVYLDMRASPFGSVEEISLANRQKKPILIVVEGGKSNSPYWLFGMLPHKYIFSSFEEAYDFLDKVNQGEYDDRWKFFSI